MANSIKRYPKLVDHKRHARNGHIPEAAYLKKLLDASNHIQSYRRKTFASWGDYDNTQAGAAGTTNLYRFRCHTGYSATHIVCRMGLRLVSNTAAVDPTVSVACTIAGGATTTETIHYGMGDGTADTSLDGITEKIVEVAVSANTTYEVLISVADYARITDFCAYEKASPVITTSTDHYVNPAEGAVDYPIFDSTREELLKGLSETWRKNGIHLYTWPGPTTGTLSPGTTWTGLFDGSTSISSASAKVSLYDFSEESVISRASDTAGTIDVVMAVYGRAIGGDTGEVRFWESNGTGCSITGITTTAQWHTTTTTITLGEDVDDFDLQYRNSNAAHSIIIGAVCLYAYL